MPDFENIKDLLKHKERNDLLNGIQWFQQLKETINAGDLQLAKDMIDIAIKKLRKDAA